MSGLGVGPNVGWPVRIEVEDAHTLKIEGVRYGVGIWETFAVAQPGEFLRFVAREPDGVITLERIVLSDTAAAELERLIAADKAPRDNGA